MRILTLLSALGLLLVAAPSASAQSRPSQPHMQSLNPSTPVVLRGNAGEARRITVHARRPAKRLSLRYRGLRANRMRSLNTRHLRTATPALRTIRAPEGRFVRRNGSYFRVRVNR